jgi:hypothetical protein
MTDVSQEEGNLRWIGVEVLTQSSKRRAYRSARNNSIKYYYYGICLAVCMYLQTNKNPDISQWYTFFSAWTSFSRKTSIWPFIFGPISSRKKDAMIATPPNPSDAKAVFLELLLVHYVKIFELKSLPDTFHVTLDECSTSCFSDSHRQSLYLF